MQTKTAKRGNRLLCLLLAVLMVCSLLPVSALAADGDAEARTGTETPGLATSGKVSDTITWAYDADAKTYTFAGTGAIPDDWEGVYNNPKIYTDVEKVIIGEGITKIGNWLFYSSDFAASLKEITLPSTLTEIGEYAFGTLINVASITIPGSVVKMGDSAFDEWTASQKIIFTGNYSKKAIAAFPTGWNANAVVEYDGPGAVEDSSSSGKLSDTTSWAYDPDTKTLTISGEGSTGDFGSTIAKAPPYADNSVYPIEHFVVEEGITEIGKYVLYSYVPSGSSAKANSTVLDIKLPDSLTTLKSYSIYRNNVLKSITFPKNVTSFDTTLLTISSCPAIEEINFEGQVTELGRIYSSLAKLKTATIPEGVTQIRGQAFLGCKALKELTIPASVTTIGSDAFKNCTGITELEIPTNVTEIGYGAFYGWMSTQTVRFNYKVTEAKEKISFDESWNAGSNARFEYLPLDSAYMDGITVALKDGDKTYPGTLDLNNLAVTFNDEVDIMCAPTFTNPEIVITKDGAAWTGGTAALSGELSFTEKSTGVYTTDAKLTFSPAEGASGDAVPVSISFAVTEKTYSFAGTGTQEDPYIVDSALALYHLSKNVKAANKYVGQYFLQTKDIDMSGIDWVPIGVAQSNGRPNNSKSFQGVYNGGGFKISNLTVDNLDLYGVALFGATNNATIENVTIDSTCSFKAGAVVGGVIGVAQATTVKNCRNEADIFSKGYIKNVYSTRAYGGGIVGYPYYQVNIIGCVNYGTISTEAGMEFVGGIAGEGAELIENCHNYGSVFGGTDVGGIVGALSGSSNTTYCMIGCSNHGAVSSSFSADRGTLDLSMGYTGGLAGTIGYQVIIEGCYNAGSVTSDWPGVGGIVGYLGSDIYIANTYNVGKVSSTYTGEWPLCAGSLFGYVKASIGAHDIVNLYYLNDGTDAIGYDDFSNSDRGFTAPIAKTGEEMKSAEFLKALQDFTTQELIYAVWAEDSQNENEGYPIITSTAEKPDYHKRLTEFKIGSLKMDIDEAAGTITGMVTNDTDLAAAAPVIQISANATVSPASGEAVDFTGGPVQYTVTAQDGTTKTYTATITKPESAAGLMAFQIQGDYAGYESSTQKLILSNADFKQNTLTYDIDCRDGLISTQMNVWAIPAAQGATLQTSINGEDPINLTASVSLKDSGKFVRSFDKLHQGKNTLTVTVTPPEGSETEAVTYTININIRPSLHSLTLKADSITVEPSMVYQSQSLTEYTINTAPSTSGIDVSFNTYGKPDSTIVTAPVELTSTVKDERSNAYTYTGTIPVDRSMDKFTITVACADETIPSTTYTFNLAWPGEYPMVVETNAEKANVTITGPDGVKLEKAADGSYLLEQDKTYTYVAAARGYKAKTGEITGAGSLTDGKLVITLEAVEPSSLTKLDALWPSFRGNSNNMAVTNAPTQVTADKTSLLWATSAGQGYSSGAVSSPIIVDGYLYAYAGTKLLKINKDTGAIVKETEMVASSDFAIVPPTYAEGMIFVGLSRGRVQAFNAETLESIWLYTDPLKGQANTPITYHDGCIYTGFWNGENKTANFVCLTIDDEDTASTTEDKLPLWTYTQKGGFYWAGAYASGQYVVVGTDDGESGYSSSTANLIVFDKDTGAVVDVKTGYTGDIRSNIAYDAQSDRIYFTSKGGYFYSEQIDWTTGKINTGASKAINLGGMSTSTPVVYNGRAYVGVSGTSQFGQYSGHHIAVLDLTSWSVAYTANSKGYPQTSGMLTTAYEEETGYVYVYFMDNYTPGSMRVIKDKAGLTALEGGVTEDGHANCAPIVFTPSDGLEQYCICSPVADENGVIYFKNDTGNMMAVGLKKAEVLTGDANGDGIIDSNDAVLVLRYYADSTTEGIDLAAADVNNDGIVDANDAVAILRLYAGNQD